MMRSTHFISMAGTIEMRGDNIGLTVRDTISGAYMLACEDEEDGIAVLDDYADTDYNLLMISNNVLGHTAFEKYVFPEYRHRGFGASLQNYLIAKTMEKGFIPFGQIEKGNQNSIRLQEKVGMTRSDNLIVWMWK